MGRRDGRGDAMWSEGMPPIRRAGWAAELEGSLNAHGNGFRRVTTNERTRGIHAVFKRRRCSRFMSNTNQPQGKPSNSQDASTKDGEELAKEIREIQEQDDREETGRGWKGDPSAGASGPGGNAS